MKVVITGATGFVGEVIVKQLLLQGHGVVVLTRDVAKAALKLGSACRYFKWDDTLTSPPLEAFEGAEAVINLMGETISKRWSEEQKKKIHQSRINGTKRLVETFEAMTVKPKVFISTSAVGIYGSRGSEELQESSQVGNDFLANVCKDWENEANKARHNCERVVIIRVGVVLGRNGGALEKMLPLFKLGAGGPAGDGGQYMSWIHVEDLALMYVEALKNNAVKGALNGTAPYPATNKEFSSTLGQVLKRPAFFPAPAFALKLALGEMSHIILTGQKVVPTKFKELNFRFRYPTLEMALKETAY